MVGYKKGRVVVVRQGGRGGGDGTLQLVRTPRGIPTGMYIGTIFELAKASAIICLSHSEARLADGQRHIK